VYERSLHEAELILSTQKEPLVSVREVWEEVVRRSEFGGFEVPSPSDFSAMLEGDKRFQIIPAQIKVQDDLEEADGDLVDTEMESLGFFSEDRIRLRTARVVEPVISEDEEEIGSIRRRAFVSKTAQAAKIAVKKKSAVTSKKSVIKSLKKNSSSQKRTTAKRTKQDPRQKSKTRIRGKK
jgi:hypothetical protein